MAIFYKSIIFSIVLTLSHCFFNTVFAGDKIPMSSEVTYAESVFDLVRAFDVKESSFLEKSASLKVTQPNTIKNLFKEKYNYTKEYYLGLHKLQSIYKFDETHSGMLNALYKNLQITKKFLTDIEQGGDLVQLKADFSTKILPVNKKYSENLNKFLNIVNSWQQSYVKKVMQ